MLRRKIAQILVAQRGDTLIEVTIALAILGFVLLGSTAIAATAFRTGQTARERTQVAATAQEQMEALRSFRDNHTWDEFQSGSGCGIGGYCGINQVQGTACGYNPVKRCFHMVLSPTGGGATTEWVPVAGSVGGSVPTSVLEISTSINSTNACAYDFELHYSFTSISSSVPVQNHISTRLANLKYTGNSSGCPAS